MLQNTPVQRLESGNPTTELPNGRIVTRPWEISITFGPQYKDKETAKLTTNCGKTTVKRKSKKAKHKQISNLQNKGNNAHIRGTGMFINNKYIIIII
jgi:hypothetical protein